MIDRGYLFRQLSSISGARVLCVGDVMLDQYVYGDVERISPEAPIPVLRVRHEQVMLGGAGNVACNLAALGARVNFIAIAGDDAAGDHIAEELDAWGDSLVSGLIRVPGRQTTIKTRFLAGTQQLMRADTEVTEPLSPEIGTAIVEAVAAALPDVSAIILSDYDKGVLNAETTGAIIKAAAKANTIIVVDPKGTDFEPYRGANLITPNRRELADATRMPVNDDSQVAAAAQKLIRDHGIGAVLVTRSAEGMTLIMDEGSPIHLPAEAREVYDVSGAGDTVVATLAAALAAGMDMVDGAALANVAAGIVVGKVGTAVVFDDDIARALRHQDISSAEAKIATPDLAHDIVAAWRNEGHRIGFTNGCFDLLHPGHISLLSQAKAACDRLVVGLNSDMSTKRLKGDSRPIQSETARAQVLASLADVDMVVIFAEDTPLQLIESLRPDVLVKGADYALEDVVGGDFVRGYGGRVLLANLEPGHSTTATIAKMGE